jgi:small subunit ribosomal protein S8
MSVDSIGDFLTVIRNGILAAKPYIVLPHSVLRQSIAQILKDEGFVRDVVIQEEAGKRFLKIVLKYVNGESVIHEITRISTPSRRRYAGVHGFKPVIGGLGISIISTSQGVVTQKKAEQLGVGGEVICTVW